MAAEPLQQIRAPALPDSGSDQRDKGKLKEGNLLKAQKTATSAKTLAASHLKGQPSSAIAGLLPPARPFFCHKHITALQKSALPSHPPNHLARSTFYYSTLPPATGRQTDTSATASCLSLFYHPLSNLQHLLWVLWAEESTEADKGNLTTSGLTTPPTPQPIHFIPQLGSSKKHPPRAV